MPRDAGDAADGRSGVQKHSPHRILAATSTAVAEEAPRNGCPPQAWTSSSPPATRRPSGSVGTSSPPPNGTSTSSPPRQTSPTARTGAHRSSVSASSRPRRPPVHVQPRLRLSSRPPEDLETKGEAGPGFVIEKLQDVPTTSARPKEKGRPKAALSIHRTGAPAPGSTLRGAVQHPPDVLLVRPSVQRRPSRAGIEVRRHRPGLSQPLVDLRMAVHERETARAVMIGRR